MSAPRVARWRDNRYPVSTTLFAAATLLHLWSWLSTGDTFTAVVVVLHIAITVTLAALTWRNRR